MNIENLKQLVAKKAIEYINDNDVVGVGSGSTVKYFINELQTIKNKIKTTVASSDLTEKLLKENGIPCCNLNEVSQVDIYIDGADEVNLNLQTIKGGGAALTREKIIATCSKKFICIVDESKLVPYLGYKMPLPIEVIKMARSFVARELVKLGSIPHYREGVITDNGNYILDVNKLDMNKPIELENILNNIVGTLENGLFAKRRADILLIAKKDGNIDILKGS